MSPKMLKVTDTFSIKSYGLTLAVDAKCRDVDMEMGEEIKILRPDGSSIKTEVSGITISCPYDPDRPFSFCLPKEITEEDVPIGSEIHY